MNYVWRVQMRIVRAIDRKKKISKNVNTKMYECLKHSFLLMSLFLSCLIWLPCTHIFSRIKNNWHGIENKKVFPGYMISLWLDRIVCALYILISSKWTQRAREREVDRERKSAQSDNHTNYPKCRLNICRWTWKREKFFQLNWIQMAIFIWSNNHGFAICGNLDKS